jgi:hypothetical protein
MAAPTTVRKYEVEYAGDVLFEGDDAAILRFESTANEKVSVLMGRRLLEHLQRDIENVLSNKLPIIRRS